MKHLHKLIFGHPPKKPVLISTINLCLDEDVFEAGLVSLSISWKLYLTSGKSKKDTLSVPLLSHNSFCCFYLLYFTSHTPTKSPSRRGYYKSYCFYHNDWKVNKGVMQFLYTGLRELHVWFVADTVANFFIRIRAETLNGSLWTVIHKIDVLWGAFIHLRLLIKELDLNKMQQKCIYFAWNIYKTKIWILNMRIYFFLCTLLFIYTHSLKHTSSTYRVSQLQWPRHEANI